MSDKGNLRLEGEKPTTMMIDFIDSTWSMDAMLSFVNKRATSLKKKGNTSKKTHEKLESDYHGHLK